MKDLGSPDSYATTKDIVLPNIEGNFEIRPNLIQLIESRPFHGLKSENPHKHLKDFEKYVDTIKVDGVSQEYLRLKLFEFSLLGKALDWLEKEVKPHSLTT